MMNATGLLSKTKTKTRECKILLMVSVVLHDNRELLFVQKIDSYLINRHSNRYKKGGKTYYAYSCVRRSAQNKVRRLTRIFNLKRQIDTQSKIIIDLCGSECYFLKTNVCSPVLIDHVN